jgi:gliding motility-associated-like protein
LIYSIPFSAKAQNCPPNIDFENGNFNGWVCHTGHVAAVGSQNVITFNYSGGPVQDRQTMFNNPGGGFDEYGFFPKNCPNGSGHSIKLGNNQPGTEAEGVSYDFTIPASASIYNLIYNYAVVFQDPGHRPNEQPRLDIEIINITDNQLISCSSFSFFAVDSPLPGFELSANPGGNTPVWFKRWTAVSINLDGYAGKQIRLFFKTADCTFQRHFGYAYVDVNTECSDKFEGATYCPDDTTVSINAPYGYQFYTWYNSSFTQVLGSGQTLSFAPPPANGTTVAVVLTPYQGYGCEDTLFATLSNTLNYTANAGTNRASCNKNEVQLGIPPKTGFRYRWEPAAGLSNPDISNPLANPDTTTTYALTAQHIGGGCLSTDSVIVTAAILDNTLELLGKPEWCIGSGDSTVLKVKPADSIQWFKNNIPIAGANQTRYKVTETGIYFAQVFNFAGCVLFTIPQPVDISSIPVPGIRVDKPAQCQINNKFVFTNTSTNQVGAMRYRWIMGDGFTATSRNITYSYKKPGTYEVQMVVYSNNACADSSNLTVVVYPNVLAEFSIEPVCINDPVLPVNKTIDPGTTTVYYLWNFGNGQTSTLRNPPVQVYPVAGNYVMSLSVSTAQCPFPLNIQKRFVRVEKPAQAINQPVAYAIANYPLTLEARPIGNNVLWQPAVSLDNATSYTPMFTDNIERQYTIKLKTAAGCITVDTQLVKINKHITIFVPNAFTPNDDSRNDLLRPFMTGIKELKYFKIFNRWGQLIYETQSLKSGWDGRFKGNPVQTQTLVWMVEGIGVDNKIYKAKGSTVLIR